MLRFQPLQRSIRFMRAKDREGVLEKRALPSFFIKNFRYFAFNEGKNRKLIKQSAWNIFDKATSKKEFRLVIFKYIYLLFPRIVLFLKTVRKIFMKI